MSHQPIQPDFTEFLRDESRRTGQAETISFPASAAEVALTLHALAAQQTPVTLQGGRTGIAAGAVPAGGHILNLRRLDRVTGLRRAPDGAGWLLRAEPGVVLATLREQLRQKAFADDSAWPAADRAALAAWRAEPTAYFFSPDPTETSATLGGMIACNASGARSFRYGATRRHIHSLRVVLADGTPLALERGRERTAGRRFHLPLGDGRVLAGALPAYRMPAVKNAAGFFVDDDMDLVDLFIGAEGTLGAIVEAELRLQPEPPVQYAVTAFFAAEADAVRFVRAVRAPGALSPPPAAIEYFDARALALLRAKRLTHPGFAELPEPPAARTAIYVEWHGATEAAGETALEALAEFIAGCGGDEAATWSATDEAGMRRLHLFRHATPEAVNTTIDERRRAHPGLTKLGTDMAVPDAALGPLLARYHGDLAAAGLEYVIFGHIGNNHLHVNILPRDPADYARGQQLYREWARAVIALGGTISAEHGVGKLKTALLREMYGAEGLAAMRALKQLFDPQGRLNRGNLFDPEA